MVAIISDIDISKVGDNKDGDSERNNMRNKDSNKNSNSDSNNDKYRTVIMILIRMIIIKGW